jgi:16S rRNA (guanine(527)-N(7))-methyltransferase RsmG
MDEKTMVLSELAHRYDLSSVQVNQFEQYMYLLNEWNERFNITRITAEHAIVYDHFADSLALQESLDLMKVHSIADVGSGGGFPGIPLKIKFPHLKLILIEVNQKKVQFLQEVCTQLQLNNVLFYTNDWRTFLRTTHYSIDLVCARASLQLDELFRMFKKDCPYRASTLVYWASEKWHPTEQELSYLEKNMVYTVGNKVRKHIFFVVNKKLMVEDN